jgi:effector-binding domain-containing protein
MMRGPDVAQYEFLKNPRITTLADMPVLEVRFNVPADGLPRVFGLLMKTYFSLPGVPKGPGMSAPRARYENALEYNSNPQFIWKGLAAIPLPASVTSLPAAKSEPELTLQLTTWKYGEVAEILHVGAYDLEPPTIQKLHEFIQAQGYEILGLHEEEYLRGPGMPFSKPENYYTIIRYQVIKKPSPSAR